MTKGRLSVQGLHTQPASCCQVSRFAPYKEQNEIVDESYLRRTFSVLLIWMTLPFWMTIWTSPCSTA